jgi:hypothetical protein
LYVFPGQAAQFTGMGKVYMKISFSKEFGWANVKF